MGSVGRSGAAGVCYGREQTTKAFLSTGRVSHRPTGPDVNFRREQPIPSTGRLFFRQRERPIGASATSSLTSSARRARPRRPHKYEQHGAPRSVVRLVTDTKGGGSAVFRVVTHLPKNKRKYMYISRNLSRAVQVYLCAPRVIVVVVAVV